MQRTLTSKDLARASIVAGLAAVVALPLVAAAAKGGGEPPRVPATSVDARDVGSTVPSVNAVRRF